MFSSTSNVYMALWVYLDLPVALMLWGNHCGWNFQFLKCLKHISSAFQDSIVISWAVMFRTKFPSLQECKGRKRLWKKTRDIWGFFSKGHILMRLLQTHNSQIRVPVYRNVHLHSCYSLLYFGYSFDTFNINNEPDEILGKTAHIIHITLSGDMQNLL